MNTKKLEPFTIEVPPDTTPERIPKIRAVCDILSASFAKYDIGLIDLAVVMTAFVGNAIGYDSASKYFESLAMACKDVKDADA